MSLRKLADELEISHAFLSQIRNGKRPLPDELRSKLEAIGAYQFVMNGKRIGAKEKHLNGDKRLHKPLDRWSGRPDSNWRHPAWKAGTLPLSYSRFAIKDSTNTTLINTTSNYTVLGDNSPSTSPLSRRASFPPS